MVRTDEISIPAREPASGEKRVPLYQLSWQAYEQILAALGDKRAVRLTYDQGLLEITMPSEEHERASRLIELFIRILVVEANLNLKALGSTTLKCAALQTSPEPDNCYYIQNEPLVRGKKVDLATDPPPDLVVEIDITHSDINKLNLYARLQVPEFWRYNGKTLTIYQLQAQQYQSVENSPTFPWIQKSDLYQFLEDCQTKGEVQAEKDFRAWVQQQFN
jgi:Uma2 family endonuclease